MVKDRKHRRTVGTGLIMRRVTRGRIQPSTIQTRVCFTVCDVTRQRRRNQPHRLRNVEHDPTHSEFRRRRRLPGAVAEPPKNEHQKMSETVLSRLASCEATAKSRSKFSETVRWLSVVSPKAVRVSGRSLDHVIPEAGGPEGFLTRASASAVTARRAGTWPCNTALTETSPGTCRRTPNGARADGVCRVAIRYFTRSSSRKRTLIRRRPRSSTTPVIAVTV